MVVTRRRRRRDGSAPGELRDEGLLVLFLLEQDLERFAFAVFVHILKGDRPFTGGMALKPIFDDRRRGMGFIDQSAGPAPLLAPGQIAAVRFFAPVRGGRSGFAIAGARAEKIGEPLVGNVSHVPTPPV